MRVICKKTRLHASLNSHCRLGWWADAYCRYLELWCFNLLYTEIRRKLNGYIFEVVLQYKSTFALAVGIGRITVYIIYVNIRIIWMSVITWINKCTCWSHSPADESACQSLDSLPASISVNNLYCWLFTNNLLRVVFIAVYIDISDGATL